MAEDVLRLEAVRKSYGVGTPAETEVLHGIDLRLAAGEFAALIGPSGSGKSTLLNLIGLLDRPSSGRILLDGQDTGALDERALTQLRGRTLGFVFQFHHLISAFSAQENVLLPLFAARGRVDEAMRTAAGELLAAVGLGAYGERPPAQLSGGQQQRIAVARALIANPALVLADEPTGNLDTASADEVFALLRRFNRERGTAFLIVTHAPQLAARCDRIIELVDGRIVADRSIAAAPPG
ncbi:MAG TPA: ABC transporter ATP-binding protein [Gammaproteobacteria bacterium]|nr:ABC transporter ATP-binding protein [Gammaproteobacteria bacterium]